MLDMFPENFDARGLHTSVASRSRAAKKKGKVSRKALANEKVAESIA